MTNLFSILLSLSLSGTFIILALLALCPLFNKYMSKTWQYYIWLLVLARLLIPLALPVNPVGSLFSKAMPSAHSLQDPAFMKKFAENTAVNGNVFTEKKIE